MRVLESVDAPGATTKFINQVVDHAPADINFTFFSWRAALTGRYDVFHVHWPEFLIRSRKPMVAAARRVLFRALLHRLRRRGTPVVRTLHNLAPHARGDLKEERLTSSLEALTSAWVGLNPCTDLPGPVNKVILHGDYRDQFRDVPKERATPGRVVFFGRIEEYKGVDGLIDEFEAGALPGQELRVVGRPTEVMRERLLARKARWARSDVEFVLRLEHVSDRDMVHEITAAEFVVLPYAEMHNSGVALVSLSLERPIIVPASCTNAALSAEVGQGWVRQYEGAFTSEVLQKAMSSPLPTTAPDLRGRAWKSVARSYAELFRAAAQRNLSSISHSHQGERSVARG